MFKRLFRDPSDLINLHAGTLKRLAFSQPPESDRPTYEVVDSIADSNTSELTDLDQRDEMSGFPLLKAIMCRIRGP